MFEKVLGQGKIKDVLSNQIRGGKIPHAYIFMGQNGVGRRFTAFEFAKILNCSVNDYSQSPTGACGHCPSCIKISENAHPDVHLIGYQKQLEVDPKAKEETKNLNIGLIRYMQKEVSTKIHEGKWKFFIIDPAEKMNEAAANCLLKTLEEPPERTIIILIAQHKETLPVTIASRSQILFFRPLKQTDIENYLMISKGASSREAEKIAAFAEGSIETAERIFDAGAGDDEAEDELSKLKGANLCICDILELSKNAAHSGALDKIDAMLAKVKEDFRLYPQNAARPLEMILNARALISKNANPGLVFDNLFMDLRDFYQKRG